MRIATVSTKINKNGVFNHGPGEELGGAGHDKIHKCLMHRRDKTAQ